MKPKVLIVVSGSSVEDVQANLPGIDVEISDFDQKEVGEPHTSRFDATCITPAGSQPGTPLTNDERARFDREMQSNFEDSKITVEVLMHIISDVPAAAAAFRAWLADAEAETAAQDPDANTAEDVDEYGRDCDEQAEDSKATRALLKEEW